MKINTLKRRLLGTRNRWQEKTCREPNSMNDHLTGLIMNTYCNINDIEVVLQHCLKKIKNSDRCQALQYGRLSGYFDETNGLTRFGEYLAQFLQIDLVNDRAI